MTTEAGSLVQLRDIHDWMNESTAWFRHTQLKTVNAVNIALLQFGNGVKALQAELCWDSGHRAVNEQRFYAEISVGERAFTEQPQMYSAAAWPLVSSPTWTAVCSSINCHHNGPKFDRRGQLRETETGPWVHCVRRESVTGAPH